MTTPVAYEFAGMTFCPNCAYVTTALGVMASGLPTPSDMDDAIAIMALAQIERGMPVSTPVAVTQTALEECEGCGNQFQREEEVA